MRGFTSAGRRIAFNAGTHTEILQMAHADFEDLVRPTAIDFVTT